MKKIIRNLLNLLPSKLVIKIYQAIGNNFNLKIKEHGLFFDAKEWSPMQRGIILMESEPGTIKWIDNYIDKSDIVYDIGANIGVFSLYIAEKKNAKVYAFEPESLNYATLNRNIFHNNLQNNIIALNIAANDKEELAVLNLSNFIAGGSCHNFNEELDPNHKGFDPVFKQGAMGVRLDYMVNNLNLPYPNHIKIDVDGNEYKVIEGMKDILASKELKSIWIELNTKLDKDSQIIDTIKSFGFYENLELTDTIEVDAWNTTFVNRLFIRKES
jgi:FkbM family methyltransferase